MAFNWGASKPGFLKALQKYFYETHTQKGIPEEQIIRSDISAS